MRTAKYTPGIWRKMRTGPSLTKGKGKLGHENILTVEMSTTPKPK